MQQATNAVVEYRRLVQPNELIEVSFKQDGTFVPLGQYTVYDIARMLGITANWLAASLSLNKDHIWSNGSYRIVLLKD